MTGENPQERTSRHQWPPGEAPGWEGAGPPPPDDTAEYPARPPEDGRRSGGAPGAAAEPFRRTTPARRKPIPALPRRGHWRLGLSTVLFVMVLGGAADYIDSVTRVSGHVLFWALVSLGLLVSVYREQRNRWERAARWPWPVAAVAGTVATELLVLFLGSPAIVTGSLILLGLGLFVLFLLD